MYFITVNYCCMLCYILVKYIQNLVRRFEGDCSKSPIEGQYVIYLFLESY